MLSPEERKTLQSYSKIAQARNKTHTNPDFWRSEFEKFKILVPSGRIIDIGCGGGRDALLFVQDEYSYLGIDLSEDMLNQARQLMPSADFQKMNMYDLDFQPCVFDGFWAAASLLHIPKRNAPLVLREIKRVMNPNGIGFFAMKEGEEEKMVQDSLGEDERFFAFYQKNEFLQMLRNNGFQILEHSRDMREYNPPKNKTVWLLYFVRIK